ncbi:MAG: RNB domain-containing ribonuclease, partial [Actinobacteria bacterium]|nr:RNB domain-containing ribonuclease [Actinomycetota bacterium]
GSSWTLRYRVPLPVESFNAEISLMTGMAAAQLMLRGGFGVLRTVPPADSRTIDQLRSIAPALGVAWPEGAAPGDVLAGLSRADSRQVAFLEHAASLLRGAAYVAFDGQPPEQPLHAGIGAPYAHATAPLRRLVDRYVSEICLAVQAGTPVPQWVRDRVPALPAAMATADHRAHAVDRAVLDLTEAWLLADRIGQTFAAVVLSADDHRGEINVDEPAIRAQCTGASLQPGQRIQARLVAADVASRTVRFEFAGQ